MSLASQVSTLTTRIATECKSIRTALARRGDGARLVTDWKARGSGQTITDATLSDDGTAHKVSPTGAGVGATTTARGLEVTWPDSTGNALYIQQNTGGTVRRIGAVFAFGPCTSTNTQSLALCTWDLPFAQPGVNAQAHFWVNPAGWELGIAVNGAVIPLTSGLFATPLAQDWTEYRAEVLIVGSTAFVALPDGSSREWTDTRIGSIAGYTACWEFFRNAGATTAPMALVEAWADTMPLPLGATSPADVTRTVRRTRIRDHVDYDIAAGTPADGNGLGWWSGANGGTGGWQPQPFITAYQRATIGGVATPAYVAAYTPDAAAANHIRMVATGNVAVAVPTGGSDSQRLTFEVQASGAARTITFAAGYEASPLGVPGRVFVIPSGAWGVFELLCRAGTWRLVYSDPPPTPAQLTYAATVTPDAWTASSFYVVATGNVLVAAPTNPSDMQRLVVEVQGSGAIRTAGISGTTTNASGATLPLSIGATKVGYLGFFYSARAGHWVLTAATAEP